MVSSPPSTSPGFDFSKVLLVRNDNIGDLICSIPAIQLLRRERPKARIDLLVNEYNAPVVEGLVPSVVDRLLVYSKTKHAGTGPGQLIKLAGFYWELLFSGYDAVVLLVGGESRHSHNFARWTRAPHIFGYGGNLNGPPFEEGLHEVEYGWRLANYVCGTDHPLPDSIPYPIVRNGERVAIQITSRKPGNRWPTGSFVELARRLYEQTGEKSILLWSPGSETTRTHPGDDEKAAKILAEASAWLEPRPTCRLQELIQVMKECRQLVTPDGGAMHLAAAMGLHVVAMFGQSDPVRWRPWTPRAIVLQSPSRTIQNISVDQVFEFWRKQRTDFHPAASTRA
jgi:heptosyltransferase III